MFIIIENLVHFKKKNKYVALNINKNQLTRSSFDTIEVINDK